MDRSNANRSIGCTVDQCEYHCMHDQYCSLDRINIGCHEENPTVVQCTDCESFKLRQQ